MKKLSASLLFVTLALVVLNIATLRELSRLDRHIAALEKDVSTTKAGRTYRLADAMAVNQRWFDKLGRAGTAQNWELARFYSEQLENNVNEMIAAKVVAEGQDVGALLNSMLVPVLQDLRKTIAPDAGAPTAFAERFTAVVNSCNHCHDATKRSFIKIVAPSGESEWAQDFRAKP